MPFYSLIVCVVCLHPCMLPSVGEASLQPALHSPRMCCLSCSGPQRGVGRRSRSAERAAAQAARFPDAGQQGSGEPSSVLCTSSSVSPPGRVLRPVSSWRGAVAELDINRGFFLYRKPKKECCSETSGRGALTQRLRSRGSSASHAFEMQTVCLSPNHEAAAQPGPQHPG